MGKIPSLLLLITSLLSTSQISWGQSPAPGDYRTNAATVTFASPVGWQRYNGPDWENAVSAPNSTSGVISIRSGHTANVTANVTLDQVVIENGGTFWLNTNTVTFSIANGPGYDIDIQSGGLYVHGQKTTPVAGMPAPGGQGNIRVRSGAKIRVDNNGGGEGDWYANNETNNTLVSRMFWENNSIFDWNLGTAYQAAGITYFPNVAANVIPIFRQSINNSTVGGNGSETTFNGVYEAIGNINFRGKIIFRNGLRGHGSINVANPSDEFQITGATAELGGSGILTVGNNGILIKSGSVTILTSNKEINRTNPHDAVIIEEGGTFDTKTYSLTGSSGFKLSNNATLKTANTSGIAGAITNTGEKTFEDGANYEFNHPIDAQNTGFPAGLGNPKQVIIDNGSALGVTLNTDLTISTALTFNKGKLILGTSNLTVNGFIGGTGADKYIVTNSDKAATNGFLIRSVGLPIVDFPIGTSTYTPVSISNSSSATDFRVRVFDDVFVNGLSGPLVDEINATVRKTWDMNPVGSANATINFHWNEADEGSGFVLSTSNRFSASVFNNHPPSNAWTNISTDDITGSNPYVTTARGINTFSRFALASPFVSLPITLLSFTGKRQGHIARLEWTTTLEKDNEGFEIERSIDAKDFKRIGFIKATASSKPINYYTFADDGLGQGNYYRLKQLDIDGQYTYSKIIHVSGLETLSSISVRPNPTQGHVHVDLPEEGLVHIFLFTANGLRLLDTEGLPGQVNERLNERLATRSAGLYLVQIRQGEQSRVIRLIKQ